MTIPCIEEKCLKYPACKSKDVIKCIPLLRWFTDIRNERKELYNFSVRHEAAWIELIVNFPNLSMVKGNSIIEHEYRAGYNDYGDK